MSFATGLKTIVVATDLHGQSEAALEYARKLAAQLRSADSFGARTGPAGIRRRGDGTGRCADGPAGRGAGGAG